MSKSISYNFKSFFYREIGRITRNKIWLFSLVVYPLIIMLLMVLLFNNGKMTNIPVAVVDQNNTTLSKDIIQSLEFFPEININEHFTNLSDAKRSLLKGHSYAVILIPESFEQDLFANRQPEIVTFYNSQLMATGSIIAKSVTQSLNDTINQLKTSKLTEQGLNVDQIKQQINIIPLEIQIAFNPTSNHFYTLFDALILVILQIMMVISGITLIRSEKSTSYLSRHATSIYSFLYGKLCPYIISYCIIFLLFYLLMFGYLKMPFIVIGNLMLLLLGTLLFILSSLHYGVLFALLAKTPYQAYGIGGLFTSPAFGFTGAIFPLYNMTTFALIWGSFIPVTWFLQIFIGQTLTGATFNEMLRPFAFLTLICFILTLLIPFMLNTIVKARNNVKRTILTVKITIHQDKNCE